MNLICNAHGKPLTREDSRIIQCLQAHHSALLSDDARDYRAMLTLTARRGDAPGTYAAWRNWALSTFAGVEMSNDWHA